MTRNVDPLERARAAHAEGAWRRAYEGFTEAGRSESLEPGDVERLATAAYMLGREEEYLEGLRRAYASYLDSGEPAAALRCAFWVGLNHARRGEMGPATGWLGRARRLLEAEPEESANHGYLLLPSVFEHEARGDWEAAAAQTAAAGAVAERAGDPDLLALAGHEHGHILIRLGRIEEGLAQLDEAMVAASAGELSPIVTGIVYCGVILACQEVHEVRRAREWTAALTGWCDAHPEMVAFTGRCLVHRAEIIQLEGAWADALAEARRAAERCLEGQNPGAAGEAWYRQGELHRLRGDLEPAQDAYREASGHGREPQPGLALLRLAQGDGSAARGTIERALDEAREPGERARLLPATVEIMLADGELEAADSASAELARLAEGLEGSALAAMAAEAIGAVELARGSAGDALPWLRRAVESWRELAAPYEEARVRESMGSPAALSATTTRPRLSSRPRATAMQASARNRTSPGSRRSGQIAAGLGPTASASVSSRCFASSPPVLATARSRTIW